MTQAMVLYTDGGCGPTNPGNGGYGIHGYLYTPVKPKKGSGCSDHIPTAEGYVSKEEAKTKSVEEVTPIHYVDGYGSMLKPSTNNIAELLSTTHGLRHAANYDITEVHVLTDSEYVRRGLESWVDGWIANGWLKHDKTEPANVKYWKDLVEARDVLVNRGVKLKLTWVKGHSDKIDDMHDVLGNILADKLATLGVTAGTRGNTVSEILVTAAEGYWKQNVEKHPFISNSRMFFNTVPTSIRQGEYYLGEGGKDEDMLGKKTADGAFAVVFLKQPDPVLEMIRNYQSKIANGTDSIIMARLDQAFRPAVYKELLTYGDLAIEQNAYNRLDLRCLDKEPLTREFRPPKLAMRAVENLSELIRILLQYIPGGDPNLVTTDITSVLFAVESKTDKKGKVTTNLKLKPEYNVGYAALKTNVNYKCGNDIGSVPVILTLGLDILDRNALKHLEEMNPKVSIISWLDAPDVFRYATIVEVGEDIGIWASCYSNQRIVSSDEKTT